MPEPVGERVWEKEGACFEGRTGGSVHLKMNRMWSLIFKHQTFICHEGNERQIEQSLCSNQRAEVVELVTVVKDRKTDLGYSFPLLLGGSFSI